MAEQENRRHQLVVNQGFQYKFIFYLASVVVLVVVCAHGLAIATARMISHTQSATQAVQQLATQAFRSSWEVAAISALLMIILGIVGVLVFGLFYSHRIAGPLFNLKRALGRVGAGDLNTEMHIRAKDEFHDVEESFNQMMAGINQHFKQFHQAIDSLPQPQKNKLKKALSEAFILPSIWEEPENPAPIKKTRPKKV